MPVRTRVEAIDRDLVVSLSGPAAERSAALTSAARDALDEADRINTAAADRHVPHTTMVDGRQTEDLASVRPDGTIIFDFALSLQNDVVRWIYDQLRLHAPVRSGRFQASITVYADGVQVEPGRDVPEGQNWVFTSLVPYARKIEGNRGKPQSSQAPNGVFEVVAALASRRFGNIARIRFVYQNPIGGATDLETWAARHASAMEGRVRQQNQYARDTRQPAVLVSFR